MWFKTGFFVLFVALIAGTAQGQKAVDFTFTDLQGIERNLFTELNKGNTVVLDFFFVDCKPCQKLTPGMVNLYNEYVAQSKKVIVFGISDRDINTKLKGFETEYNVTYSSTGVEGGGDTITDLYKGQFNLQGWPTYAVICPNRKVYWDLERDSSFVKLRNAIDSCQLNMNAISPVSANLVAVYPNPAEDFISINAVNLTNYSITIISLEGKELLHQSSLMPEAKVDVKSLKSGLYIVQIEENGWIHRSKIIIKK